MFVGTKRKEGRMNRGRISKRRGQIQELHRRKKVIGYLAHNYKYRYKVG
jgi:hypothetical protein